MGLWTKGINRLRTGKPRLESVRFDIEKLNMLESAFNRYFTEKHPGKFSKPVIYKITGDTLVEWNIIEYKFVCRCSWNETRNMEHVLDLLNKEIDFYIYSHLYSTEPELYSFHNRLRMILNISGDKFKHVYDMIWK